MTASPDAIARLRAVAMAPLTLFAAFGIAEADIVTVQWLRMATDLSQSSISRHMPVLCGLGLVEQVNLRAYRLTPRGRAQLALPLDQLMSGASRQKDDMPPNTNQPALLPPEPSRQKDDLPPGTVPPQISAPSESPADSGMSSKRRHGPLTTTTNIYSESDSHTVVVGDLPKNFAVALRAAHVFPNTALHLAAELIAEDGPGWLRQTLGWIATLRGENSKTRGATICEALKARASVPDESFLPPAALSFHEQLAWAQRVDQPAEDDRSHLYDGYLHPDIDEREGAHQAVEQAVHQARDDPSSHERPGKKGGDAPGKEKPPTAR